MNKKKIIFIPILTAIIIILLFFYFTPIYMIGFSVLKPRLLSLSDARNYYTVLSSFITLLGLFLGYLYYHHKLKVYKENIDREKKRQNLNYLIEEINNYDKLVGEIIHCSFKDSSELAKIRLEISRRNERITAMLMHKTQLLGFNDEDAQKIIRVHSYVEQGDILMKINYQEMSKDELASVKSKYADLIFDARQTCFEKIC